MATQEKMLSTYARLFIGFFKPFGELVTQYSRQSPSKPLQVLPITILSEEQVTQTLFHPHNSTVKEMIHTAYKDARKADHDLLDGQDSLDTQRRFIETSLEEISSRKSTESTKLTRDALEKQYVLLNNIQNAIKHGHSQLNDIEKDFEDFVSRQNTEWVDYRTKYLGKLSEEISNRLPAITPGEIENLERQDLQDARDRFVDLGISKDFTNAELNKILNLENPDFDTYFKTKAFMAIRSAIPLDKEKISQVMKSLDNIFVEAKNEGQALSEKQKAEIHNIDNTKVKPLLDTIDRNNKTLKTLESDREKLLPPEAIEAIEEKIQRAPALETPKKTL